MAYSSQEDGEGVRDESEHLEETYGTPPLRRNLTGGRLDKLAGAKKLRKLPSHTESSRKDKQGRRSRNLTKQERQKERLDARAFKELDTTLQVLGIDGNSDAAHLRVTASPHAPILHSSMSAHKQKLNSDALEFSSRLSLDSTSSLAGEGRAKARSQSMSERKRSGSSPALARNTLEDERQRWHAGLDNLLQGNLDQDDLQVALSLASGKAGDLKEQLIYWQTPPEATWPAREERLEWLHQALTQMKDITIGLQQHGVNWKETEHIKLYRSIILEVGSEMEGMASMCCDAIVEGLLSLKDGPQDIRRAFRAARRVIALVIPTAEKQRKLQKIDQDSGWGSFSYRLGEMAVRVVHAMMEAAGDLQDSLLQCSAMTVTIGQQISGHEVSDRCKQLQHIAWQNCAEIVAVVFAAWPEQTTAVNCMWCKLMLGASRLANEMQRNLPWCSGHFSGLIQATNSGLSDDSVGSYIGAGVWGTSSTSVAQDSVGDVSDEDLQAQAWLPGCLTSLLANAEKAATAALGCEDWRACQGLVEELSEALYELAVTGNHRVGSMCVSPSGLACWALELLEEQACQAVVFVRDLDRSVLGRGEHGLVHYETLRKATDTLVNSILRVRRLLKQKRVADEDSLPRPLPVIRSDSQSSLTSALQRQQAATSAPVVLPAKKADGSRSIPRASNLGRPPLANGTADNSLGESRGLDIPSSSGRTANGMRAQEDETADNDALPNRARRRKSRHNHGTATPPIPEDSDGEAGGSHTVERPDSNGLDYREERDSRQQSRRHRHRKVRHSRQKEDSPEEDGVVEQRAEDRSEDNHFAMDEVDAEQLDLPNTVERRVQQAQDAELAMADPFAQAAVQSQPIDQQPGGIFPLAIFSSASTSSARSNSLVPAGSSTLFKFGSFSTSPTQANGMLSPRALLSPGPRGIHSSPFAGVHAPSSAFNFARSSSNISSTSQAGLPAMPKLETKPSQPVAEAALTELAGPPLPLRHASSSRETAEWNGHPMSDPTNGYHHVQHHPMLARVSGEGLKRQGSSDSSEDSASGSRSGSASGQNSRVISIEGQESSRTASTVADSAVAFKLPWEGDPFWQIKWEELKPTLIRKIGNGSFGQVYEAYFHCAPMAVKIINIDGDATALPGALLRFKQEVDLQRTLSLFPHIVRFLGACCHIPDGPPGNESAYTTSNVTLAIVMELCRLGTLFKLIEWARKVSKLPTEILSGAAPPRTPEEQKLKASPGFRLYSSWQLRLELAKHAAAAVEFMHANKVVHRDLTSYNLLVTDKFEAKVADFNLSRAMKGEMVPSSGVVNSPEWQAPERLNGYYGFASDVFSFGVILWELVTLAWPWHETESDVLLSSEEEAPEGVPGAENGVPEPDAQHRRRDPFYVVLQSVTKGHRLEFPPCEDIKPPLPQIPRIIELAKACWKQNPVERPTMTTVCRELDAILEGVKKHAREERRRKQPGT